MKPGHFGDRSRAFCPNSWGTLVQMGAFCPDFEGIWPKIWGILLLLGGPWPLWPPYWISPWLVGTPSLLVFMNFYPNFIFLYFSPSYFKHIDFLNKNTLDTDWNSRDQSPIPLQCNFTNSILSYKKTSLHPGHEIMSPSPSIYSLSDPI